MIYAVTKDKKRISSYDSIEKDKYFCPSCGGEVILKRGKTNVSHFAHKNLLDCDIFTSEMSEWHISWQNKFPIETRKVIIKHTFNQEDRFTREYNIKIGKEYIHRADVCIGNYVIEFQHSNIKKEQFMLRNYFYAQCGYKVIWLFDFRDEFSSGRMKYYDEWSNGYDNGGKWKWSNPPRFLSDISPHRNKMIKLIFQFADDKNDGVGYIGLVTWAMDSNVDISGTDYKRFFTSYKIMNHDELYESIISKEI